MEASLDYLHVDVFSDRPYNGNSLAVFPNMPDLEEAQLLRITQELRHFETIFLTPQDNGIYRARVFDLFGELAFAGHPVLGAASVLHHLSGKEDAREWVFSLPDKSVRALTRPEGGYFVSWIDQGRAEFIAPVPASATDGILEALGLTQEQLHPGLPMEVVSTGLRYLIVPLSAGLDRAGIVVADFEERLAALGAEFAYLLDVPALEGRHWNNDGIMEDVATGSAAGTVGAYLVKHRVKRAGEAFRLNQGRFLDRPSVIHIRVDPDGADGEPGAVHVGGDVSLVARGRLTALPEA